MNSNKFYHHYIPQFYLRNFLNQGKHIGKLALLDIGKQETRHVSVKRILGAIGFFEIDGIIDENIQQIATKKYGSNVTHNTFEKELQKLEYIVALILQSIVENKQFENLYDIYYLIYWLTWLYIANPLVKKILAQRDPQGFNTSRLNGFMSWHEKALPCFRAKSWGLTTSDYPLMTSDRPVILNPKPEIPIDLIAINKAVIIFPINPTILLIGTPNKNNRLIPMKTKKLNEQQAFEANYLLFNNTDNMILAQDRQHIELFLQIYNLGDKP